MSSVPFRFQREIFFSIASEQELILSFSDRDQRKLIVPSNLRFPIPVRSYFTWRDPSNIYTYLIFKMPNWDQPRGVAFKRTASGTEPTGGLCNWCHAYGPSDEIGLLSIAVNSKTSVAYFLCQDLRCIEKIEEAAELAGKNPEKNIDLLYSRIAKLFESIYEYKPD